MKKTKLITSLSSIGVLLSSTPIIATSCSENKTINRETYYSECNTMDFNDKHYELIDNIDPNLFAVVKYNPVYIPLKDGSTQLINYDEWNLLVGVKLISCDPNIKVLDNNFLSYCKGLREVDLSGLTYIREIGHNFLIGCYKLNGLDLSPLVSLEEIGGSFCCNCSGLQFVNLPFRYADGIDFSNSLYFFYDVPKNIPLYGGKYVNSYRNTKPWKSRVDQMVGETNYFIEMPTWEKETVKVDGYNCAELKLVDSGFAPWSAIPPVTWVIDDETSKCLNAYISYEPNYHDLLVINPSEEAVGKFNTIAISAYWSSSYKICDIRFYYRSIVA